MKFHLFIFIQLEDKLLCRDQMDVVHSKIAKYMVILKQEELETRIILKELQHKFILYFIHI